MGGLSNYMSPYVEDYESVMDEHELEMMLRDRALTEALEYRDGMLHSPFLDDSYGDDLGDLRGRRLR